MVLRGDMEHPQVFGWIYGHNNFMNILSFDTTVLTIDTTVLVTVQWWCQYFENKMCYKYNVMDMRETTFCD
jgi:hypothetical protein